MQGFPIIATLPNLLDQMGQKRVSDPNAPRMFNLADRQKQQRCDFFARHSRIGGMLMTGSVDRLSGQGSQPPARFGFVYVITLRLISDGSAAGDHSGPM